MTRGLTLIVAALVALAPFAASAQTTPAQPSGTAAGAATAPAAPATKPPAAPALTVTPYGFVQLTADLDAGVFAGDQQYPGVVALSSTPTTSRAFFMHARNSRFGVRLGLPSTAFGAKLGAVFEVDFRGGFCSATGCPDSNISSYQPLMRLRLAYGTATWAMGGYNVTLLAGQEYGLVTPLFATSAAYTGDPIFWKAGNTWHRAPQLRLSGESTGPFGLLWQAAVLSPQDSGSGTETAFVGPGARSRRPDLEGRLAANLKGGKDGKTKVVEVGVAGHIGWERYSTASSGTPAVVSAGPTEDLRSEMVGVDVALNFGLLGFKGEAWRGSNIEDYFTVGGGVLGNGTPGVRSVRSRGMWGQLVLQPTPMLQLVAGAGIEQPNRADVGATALRQNRMLSGGVIANPSKNWRAGVEVTKTLSLYGAAGGSTEKQGVQTAITTAFVF